MKGLSWVSVCLTTVSYTWVQVCFQILGLGKAKQIDAEKYEGQKQQGVVVCLLPAPGFRRWKQKDRE